MAKQCDVSVADLREAVLSLLRREEPATVITRRVGVSEPTLYRWRDEFLAAVEQALASKTKQGKSDSVAREVAELQQLWDAWQVDRDVDVGAWAAKSHALARSRQPAAINDQPSKNTDTHKGSKAMEV